MEVTYCASPVLAIREFTMGNRILTSNLLNNDKLDVKFNYSALDCYIKCDSLAYNAIPKFDHPFFVSYALCKETLRLYMSSYHYPKQFAKGFNTDIVILSCTSNWFDYPFVVELLNNGFKVVLGGTNFTLWRTSEWVENTMRKMGVKEKYIKNFIVVQGLVDLTTDLHKIIKEWKHCKITENDFSTIWDCETDYLQNIKNTIYSSLNIDMEKGGRDSFYNITFLLNNNCFWGKCAFCGFTLQPRMDFDNGIEPEIIARNIINTCKRFNGNKIYFSNDYFQFTEKNKKILETINKNGIDKINCFSGIKLLQNEKYIENCNKYGFKYLKVGLEAGTDFSLDKFNKGYGESDVDDAISKMIKYLDKDTEIVLHSIIDSPQISKEEVKRNYQNILKWKTQLIDAGIATNVVASSYAIIKDINDHACIDNNFIRPCEIEDCESGRIKFLNEMAKTFGDDIIPVDSYDHHMGFNRYDKDGKMLQADFELLADDKDNIIQELYGKDTLFCPQLEEGQCK